MKKIFQALLLTVLITSLGCPHQDVEKYLRDLKSPNEVNKREAINKTGELKIKEAVPELISMLHEDSADINAEIIEALGKIGDNAAVEPLMTKLNDDNALIRKKTIEALGKIGDKKAVPALASIVEHQDGKVEVEVLTAIWALGNIGDKSSEPILSSLLKQDNNKYIRYNIEKALKKISATKVTLVKTKPAPEKGKVPQPEDARATGEKQVLSTSYNLDISGAEKSKNSFPFLAHVPDVMTSYFIHMVTQAQNELDKETTRWLHRLGYQCNSVTAKPAPEKDNMLQDDGSTENPIYKTTHIRQPKPDEMTSYIIHEVFQVKNKLIKETARWLQILGYQGHISKSVPEKGFYIGSLFGIYKLNLLSVSHQQSEKPAPSDLEKPVNTEVPILKQTPKSVKIEQNQPVQSKAVHQSKAQGNTTPKLAPQFQSELKSTDNDVTILENKVYNLNELPSSIKQSLPEFFITFSIYTDDPTARIVKINDQMLREGEHLTAGLKLEEISMNGVIFSSQNYRFHVRLR